MPRRSTKTQAAAVPQAAPMPTPAPATVPMYAYAGVGQNSIPNVPQPEEEFLSGLYVFGIVSDRTRRTIPTRDNGTAEIVTYTIQDSAGRRYFVDEYSPTVYNEKGAYVEIPVYVKTFKKRNGDVSYSFAVQQQKEIGSRGEPF